MISHLSLTIYLFGIKGCLVLVQLMYYSSTVDVLLGYIGCITRVHRMYYSSTVDVLLRVRGGRVISRSAPIK